MFQDNGDFSGRFESFQVEHLKIDWSGDEN